MLRAKSSGNCLSGSRTAGFLCIFTIILLEHLNKLYPFFGLLCAKIGQIQLRLSVSGEDIKKLRIHSQTLQQT